MKKVLSWIGLLLIPVVFIGGILLLSNVARPPSVSFSPQKTQLFKIGDGNNNPLDVLATTLPQFALSLADGKFSNLWKAYASGNTDTIDASLVNDRGDTAIVVNTQLDPQKKEAILTPKLQNAFKPGLYHLTITTKTVEGKDITITQDFTWGVLAINTSKVSYQPGETVKIGMGVLDDLGNTKCIAKGDIDYPTAKVWLTIVSPSGQKQNLSTDDGTIVGSPDCRATSITDNPDFQAQLTAGQETGKYTIHMTAENINGERSIDDYFYVSNIQSPFDIMRVTYPTRIYPYGHYPVVIEVVANQDYSGPVSDFVPDNFTITNISDNGSISEADNNYSQITWQVNWQKGQTYTLGYEIKFPLVSPEFYLVGPLTIGNFSEGREWMIASDAIALVQKATSGIVTTNGTITATFGSAITVNDLEIVECGSTGSTTITAPAQGSPRSAHNAWTSYTIASGNAPRLGMYYRIAKSGDALALTCSIANTNPKAIYIYEYSGIGTSGEFDSHNRLQASAACNSTPFQATLSDTTTNANDLLVDITVATAPTPRTITGQTFNSYYSGSGTTGTFSSADDIAGAAGAYSDTVTFSSGAGACSMLMSAFTPPLVLTQNSYQFFTPVDSLNGLTGTGSKSTPITLTSPGAQFRIRMNVDADGSTTIAANNLTMLLEYAVAPISNDCSTLDDSAWNTVDSLSTNDTPIAYDPYGDLSSGTNISVSSPGTDPQDTSPHTYTISYEDYYQSYTGDGSDDVKNIQNALSDSHSGLWDFSLVDNSGDTITTTYCLRLVNSDGLGNPTNDLDSYLQYPQITTFYFEVNILGPGNSGANATTTIRGPGNGGANATTKIE